MVLSRLPELSTFWVSNVTPTLSARSYLKLSVETASLAMFSAFIGAGFPSGST